MFKKDFFVILISSFLATSVDAQQLIVRNSLENGKIILYSSKESLMIGGEKKGMKLSATFQTDPKTLELKDFLGFNYFTLGLGKCFFNDSIAITLQNGVKLNLISSNPELCEVNRSGWFNLSPQQFDTLLSAPIKKIHFINTKSGEQISEDIIDPQDQMYFQILKELMVKKEIINKS